MRTHRVGIGGESRHRYSGQNLLEEGQFGFIFLRKSIPRESICPVLKKGHIPKALEHVIQHLGRILSMDDGGSVSCEQNPQVSYPKFSVAVSPSS